MLITVTIMIPFWHAYTRATAIITCGIGGGIVGMEHNREYNPLVCYFGAGIGVMVGPNVTRVIVTHPIPALLGIFTIPFITEIAKNIYNIK